MTELFKPDLLNQRIDVWIECWNQALKANSKRVYLFDRKQQDAFLKLSRLESPFSVYFRYLLLELMASLENSGLEDREKDSVKKLLCKARKLYLEELISQQEKALRRTEPSLSTSARNIQARKKGEGLLRDLCKTWFSIKRDDFNQWLAGISVTVPSDTVQSEDDEVSDLEDEHDYEDDVLLDE